MPDPRDAPTSLSLATHLWGRRTFGMTSWHVLQANPGRPRLAGRGPGPPSSRTS
jgi:hypothetical protein